MNTKAILTQMKRLHANAINGTLKLNGDVYDIKFDAYHSHYCITSNALKYPIRYNTRRLAQAKKWLKEHLED